MPPKSRAKVTSGKKSAQIPKTPQDLENVLAAFLCPDNAIIAQATATIKAFLNSPASIPALFHRLSVKDGREDTRQLACVLITKKITKFWSGLHHTKMLNPQQTDAQTCREYIINILHSGDAPRLLLHSLSYLTSIIARVDFKRKRWPQLQEWLVGALSSPNINHVEASLRILYSVLESKVSNVMEPYFDAFYPLFCGWIQNAPDSTIRHRAILALHSLLGAIENEEKQDAAIRNTLPSLIPALISCNQNEEWDSVKAVITILTSSMESEGFEAVVGDAIQNLVPIVLNMEIDLPVRTLAVQFLNDYVATRPVRVTQQTTLQNGTTIRILDVLLHIAFNMFIEEDPDPFCHDVNNAQKLGISMLEELFRYIPRDEVYAPCLVKFSEFVLHQDENYRKAAWVIVTTCAEHVSYLTYDGQHVTYKGQTMPLLNIALIAGTELLPQEPSELVKDAICIALAWLASEFSSVIERRNLFIEPVQMILKMLDITPPGALRKRLFMVLDAYIECIGQRVVDVLPAIMAQLNVQINQQSIEQQEAAIDTISCIALSVGEAFRPYFPGVLPIIKQILSVERNEEIASIQDKAIKTLSSCARAVGVEAWTPEVKEFLFQVTQTCLKTTIDDREESDYNIQTASLNFLGNVMATLAEVDGEIAPEVIDMLSKTYDASIYALQSIDGINYEAGHEDAPKLGGLDGDDDGDDEALEQLPEQARLEAREDEEEIFHSDSDYYFDQDALETKSSAMSTLVMLLCTLGPKMYLLKPCKLYEARYPEMELEDGQALNAQTVLPGFVKHHDPEEARRLEEEGLVEVTQDPMLRLQHVILDTCAYFTDHALTQALTVLTTTLEVVAAMCNLPKDVGVRPQIPDKAEPLFAQPMMRFIEIIENNEDPVVVAHSLNQLTHLLDHWGPALIATSLAKDLYESLDAVLKEDALCLTAAEFKDIRSDQGEEVLEACFELIGQLARWLGPVFLVEYLNSQERLNLLIQFCSPERPDTFRGNAVGCLAEILQFTGAAAAHFTPILFPLVATLVQDQSAGVRHNCLFLAGECAQLCTPELTAQLPADILPAIFKYITTQFMTKELYNSAETTTDQQASHDNAVSAALRFVLAFPNLFSYDNIPAILNTLPLSGDDIEVVKLMTYIPRVLQVAFEQTRPLIPQIIVQLGQILARNLYELREGSQGIFISLVKSLFQQCPTEAQQAIALLSDDVEAQKALQAALA